MYEVHITIEPVFTETRMEELRRISEENGFKPAHLAMLKEGKEPETSRYDTFITGHWASYYLAEQHMRVAILYLKSAGFRVWRYKIESIVLDSKYEHDPLDLLEILYA